MPLGTQARLACPWPLRTWLVFPSRPQSLYVCLPALLECPPFQTEHRESWCSAPQLPEELRRVVSVYQATLDLLRQFRVHPEIAAQVLAYLLFFSSTLLFNQLLDKGEEGRAWGHVLLGAAVPVCRKAGMGVGVCTGLSPSILPLSPWLGEEGQAQRRDVDFVPAFCPPESLHYRCQSLLAGGPAGTWGNE